MGIFSRLFPKKRTPHAEDAPEYNPGPLEQAEEISNIVALGLEQGNYAEISQQLVRFAPQDEKRERYVFDHPKIVGSTIVILACVIFSLLYLYFFFIGVCTILFSSQYVIYGMTNVIVPAALLTANITIILKLILSIKFMKRYEAYSNVFRFKSFEIVGNLAALCGRNETTVVDDLNCAIEKKLIPQGHFTRDNLAFMISNRLFDKYSEKQAVYDRYFKQRIEEKDRVDARTEEISRIIETGTQYIEKIHDSQAIMKDRAVIKKLERMEIVVSMIFQEVDSNPSQAHSLGMFLNCYLSTAEKLIEGYISINEKQIIGKSLTNTKKDIESSLNIIVKAFENILEKMYAEMDISSDIAAMEIMMKQEGLAD